MDKSIHPYHGHHSQYNDGNVGRHEEQYDIETWAKNMALRTLSRYTWVRHEEDSSFEVSPQGGSSVIYAVVLTMQGKCLLNTPMSFQTVFTASAVWLCLCVHGHVVFWFLWCWFLWCCFYILVNCPGNFSWRMVYKILNERLKKICVLGWVLYIPSSVLFLDSLPSIVEILGEKTLSCLWASHGHPTGHSEDRILD